MELLIIVALIFLNGIFSMSELSLVSSKKFKLENAAKEGNKGAKTALKLSENPSRFLSTVQIGITLIGIILGFYSGDALSDDFADLIGKIGFLKPYADKIAGPFIVIFITYLSIVFGELFPKQIGMVYPEKTAAILAVPMNILSKITAPFVWLLSVSNDFLMRLFGINNKRENTASEEEIKSIVKESAEVGEIENIESTIVERVFELGDARANTLMTYKNELIYFDLEDSRDEIFEKINQHPHNAYPVVEDNNIDRIRGIVLMKDFFGDNHFEDFSIEKLLKEPVYLPETMAAYQILEHFRSRKMHYGIVIDEYGNTQGMVTMDDVVDVLVGDMSEEPHELRMIPKSKNSWLVDGQFPLKTFTRNTSIKLDREVLENIHTVAGMIVSQINDIPEPGEQIKIGNFAFRIVDKSGQRINKILVTKTEKNEDFK